MSALVLVVEDTPANMKLLTMVLRNAGHDVLQAHTAEEALPLAQQRRPDLVVMDVQLPGVDGLSATRMLRADERTRAIPVLAVTALAMSGDEERIRAAGCNGYMAKPIRYQLLLREVERLLAGGGGAG